MHRGGTGLYLTGQTELEGSLFFSSHRFSMVGPKRPTRASRIFRFSLSDTVDRLSHRALSWDIMSPITLPDTWTAALSRCRLRSVAMQLSSHKLGSGVTVISFCSSAWYAEVMEAVLSPVTAVAINL